MSCAEEEFGGMCDEMVGPRSFLEDGWGIEHGLVIIWVIGGLFGVSGLNWEALGGDYSLVSCLSQYIHGHVLYSIIVGHIVCRVPWFVGILILQLHATLFRSE